MYRFSGSRDHLGQLTPFTNTGTAARTVVQLDTTNLVIWLDAAASYITKDGSNKVSQWSPKSGDFTFTQGTPYATWIASGVNGLPSIRMDASTVLAATGTVALPNTVYIVMKNTWTSNQTILYLDGVTGHARFWMNPAYGSPEIQYSDGATAEARNARAQNGCWEVVVLDTASATAKIQVGNSAQTTATPSQMAGVNNPYFGASNAEVAEMLVYNVTHNDTQKNAVREYLRAKYNLWNLSDNPISTVPTAWWDMVTTGWLTKDGSNYTSIARDRSGNVNHFLQTVLSKQPIYGADGLLVDGVDDFMLSPAFTQNMPYTLFAVIKQAAWTQWKTLFCRGDQSQVLWIQHSATPQISVNSVNNTAGHVSPTLSERKVFTFKSVSGNSYAKINKGSAATDGVFPSVGIANGLEIGATNPGDSANVNHLELMLYPGDISPADEALVQDYLIARHGVS